MRRRVVITGIGVVSSIGIGREEFWKALIQGISGISRITSFDTSVFSRHYGGEIRNFQPQEFIAPERVSRFGRASALAIGAAKLALKDAHLCTGAFDSLSCGVFVGTTMGESQVLERINQAWVRNGLEEVETRLIPMYPAYVLSENVADELGLYGPNMVIPTACAAGNYAIGYACDIISGGEAEVMLAGGTDAFSRIAFIGFNRLLAIAPEKCQPFDRERKGMLVAEGSAMLVLEELGHALARKAEVYAEVVGYGLSCDAYHMTAPDALGIATAIEKALKASGVSLAEVGYISAHGTGTPSNDKAESAALKMVFGDYLKKIPVSSIKSMLGHPMGAASAIEAACCALTVKNDIIPPTINFQTPDPECDIDCVPNLCRRQRVDVALNNASAFGGNNACLVLRKFFRA